MHFNVNITYIYTIIHRCFFFYNTYLKQIQFLDILVAVVKVLNKSADSFSPYSVRIFEMHRNFKKHETFWIAELTIITSHKCLRIKQAHTEIHSVNCSKYYCVGVSISPSNVISNANFSFCLNLWYLDNKQTSADISRLRLHFILASMRYDILLIYTLGPFPFDTKVFYVGTFSNFFNISNEIDG